MEKWKLLFAKGTQKYNDMRWHSTAFICKCLMSHSVIIKETPSVVDGNLSRNSQLENLQRVRNDGTFRLNGDFFIKSLLLGLREYLKRWGRKNVKASWDGRQQGNKAFQTQQGWWMNELKETEAACPDLAYAWTKWGSNTERRFRLETHC